MLIKDFWVAIQKGRQLTDSEVWKNRTIAGGVLTSVLVSVAAISKAFGVDLGLDEQTIEAAAYGIAALYSVFAAASTAATSAKVGLSSGREDQPTITP